MSLEVQGDKNEIDVNVNTPIDELIKATCTIDEQYQIQNGSDCQIIISVKKSDDNKLNTLNNNSEYNVALLVDISLLKCFGDAEIEITDTNSEISVEIQVPEYLRNQNHKFVVIRYHNGETSVLEDIDDSDNTVTFRSDKFSLYGIAYLNQTDNIEDDASLPKPESSVITSDQGDTANEDNSLNITSSLNFEKLQQAR